MCVHHVGHLPRTIKIFYWAPNRMNKVFQKYSRYLLYSGLKICYIHFAKSEFKYTVQLHLSVSHKVSLCYASDCCASLLPLQSILDFWRTRCKETDFSLSYFSFPQSLVFHQCPVLSLSLFFSLSYKIFATGKLKKKICCINSVIRRTRVLLRKTPL
jgi:hypothetical protein